LAIQAFSGGIQQLPTPDFNLSTTIADGDLLVYRSIDKAFHNETNSFTTLAQVNQLIANINSGGSVDLSGYVLSTTLAAEIATLNTAISVKADTTYVDAQIAGIDSPDLSNYVTTSALSGSLANYDTSTEVTGKINTAIANASFFDGDYNNLTNTPVIPDLTGYATQAWVQNQIATTDVGDLTDVNSLLSGGGATTLGALTDVSTTGATTGQVLKYNGTSWEPASDNTSGGGGSNADTLDSQDGTYYLDYNNFTNTPSIPTDTDTTYTAGTGLTLTGTEFSLTYGHFDGLFSSLTSTPTTLAGYGITDAFDGDYTNLTNKPTLFDGDYTNLTNKPTLFDGAFSSLTNTPTTLAGYGITDGGSGGATYTAGTNITISAGNVISATDTNTTYTNVSEFTNDSGYLTSVPAQTFSSLTGTPTTIAGYGITDAFDGAYSSLTGAPTIPADVSDLTDTTNLLTGAAYTDASVDTHLNRSSAATNQVLSWNGTDYAWVNNSGGGGGATSLGGLSDVSSTAPTNGQVLKWDSANSTWAPALDATSGISGSSYATEAYVDQKLLERGDHFSGDYNDLTNTPVLFSGDYADLLNKPAGNSDLSLQIVSGNLQLLNVEPDPDTVISSVSLSSLGAAISYNDLANTPNLFSGDYNDLVNRPNLFSGSYTDLTNKPYIPSIAGLASTSYVDSKVIEPNVIREVRVSNIVLATHDNYVMSIETTDATPTEALLTTGSRIVIDNNSTVMYNVHIIGADGTDNYGIKLQGIIDKTSGTLALIGTPSRETLADTTSDTWSGSVSADTVNSSLKITVTGEAAKTVNWTIFVEQNAVKR
jgi:hypothetical protein